MAELRDGGESSAHFVQMSREVLAGVLRAVGYSTLNLGTANLEESAGSSEVSEADLGGSHIQTSLENFLDRVQPPLRWEERMRETRSLRKSGFSW